MNRRYFRSAAFTILLSILLLSNGISLKGQEAADDSVTDKIVHDLQLTALQDKLNAQRWWYGWLAGYSAATAGQVIVSVSSENIATRQDMALGAATTFLGAIGQLIAPMGPRDLFGLSYL